MVDRASILNNDKDNNVITLEIDNNKLKITSMSLEIGKVEEKMIGVLDQYKTEQKKIKSQKMSAENEKITKIIKLLEIILLFVA